MPLNRLSIQWSAAALVVFYRLSVSSATSVDRAVIQLAETGAGNLEWLAPYHRLRVGNFNVMLVIDKKHQTVYVLAIYRAASERIH